MRHNNSIFSQVLKFADLNEFDRLVDKHNGDFRSRRLSMKDQLITLLYGQFAGSQSLRDIQTSLSSHQTRLYHVGAKLPARSTLADANANRPWLVFSEFFNHTMKQVHPGLRRKLAKQTRLIDATKVKLSGLSADWSRFSKDLCAAKMHIVYDPNEDCPITAEITPDNVNDITPAKAMKIEPGVTYVFDLAYYDYGWWQKLDAAGCRFVTRRKKNTKPLTDHKLPVKKRSNILSDCIGHLPERMARSRRNPFQDPLREIQVKIANGKTLCLLTNDLDASAEEIADLYKQRWQIELFFKWIKQHLKIKHFLGISENAVRIQLYVALIAFLILKMAKQANADVTKSPLMFARLVRANLMHLKEIARIAMPEPPGVLDTRQIQMELTPC